MPRRSATFGVVEHCFSSWSSKIVEIICILVISLPKRVGDFVTKTCQIYSFKSNYTLVIFVEKHLVFFIM